MGKNDIRDNRSVQREFDISLTSAASIKRLLQYIGLKEGELTTSEMDSILNAQRIEN
jgi:hypothetical protein